jgi:hypothetical protein
MAHPGHPYLRHCLISCVNPMSKSILDRKLSHSELESFYTIWCTYPTLSFWVLLAIWAWHFHCNKQTYSHSISRPNLQLLLHNYAENICIPKLTEFEGSGLEVLSHLASWSIVLLTNYHILQRWPKQLIIFEMPHFRLIRA